MEPEISKKKLITVIVIVVVLVIGAAVAAIYGGTFKSEKKNPNVVKAQEQNSDKLINPLTGEEVTALPARPFILSTDNDSPPSRPQSGLSKADIVYEVPIEGGGSRLEPIYYSKTPKKIGPARSARPYIVDIAREYKAVLVHNGWSKAAKAYLETNVVPYMPAIYYWNLFWRSDDRKIPHNCYTDGKTIRDKIKEKGWNKKQTLHAFTFLGKNEKAKGEDISEINVNYVSAKNTYKYDKKSELYNRFISGEVYTDKETGKQITTANVLLQYIDIKVLDDVGRLEINLTKGGDATLFTKGKMVKGTWSRKDLDSPTIFKDQDGKEFKLSTGNTWIQLVDRTVKVSYK